jgi:hypothetical protein
MSSVLANPIDDGRKEPRFKESSQHQLLESRVDVHSRLRMTLAFRCTNGRLGSLNLDDVFFGAIS